MHARGAPSWSTRGATFLVRSRWEFLSRWMPKLGPCSRAPWRATGPCCSERRTSIRCRQDSPSTSRCVRRCSCACPPRATSHPVWVHHCAEPRHWTTQEKRLFEEIGRRLTDALTGLLIFRSLRENQRQLDDSQRIAHVGYWDRDLESGRMTLSDEACLISSDFLPTNASSISPIGMNAGCTTTPPRPPANCRGPCHCAPRWPPLRRGIQGGSARGGCPHHP